MNSVLLKAASQLALEIVQKNQHAFLAGITDTASADNCEMCVVSNTRCILCVSVELCQKLSSIYPRNKKSISIVVAKFVLYLASFDYK